MMSDKRQESIDDDSKQEQDRTFHFGQIINIDHKIFHFSVKSGVLIDLLGTVKPFKVFERLFDVSLDILLRELTHLLGRSQKKGIEVQKVHNSTSLKLFFFCSCKETLFKTLLINQKC